jgi:hypothetical protein
MTAEVVALLSYRPEEDELVARFRYWHVESLLNQAAELVDRCLGEMREFKSLDFAWHQLRLDYEEERKSLELATAQASVFERELAAAKSRRNYFNGTDPALVEIEKLASAQYKHLETSIGYSAEFIRSAQNIHEQSIERASQATDREVNDKRIAWGEQDVEFNKARLKAEGELLDKREHLLGPGQPLDLGGQANLVLRRLTRDYEDALNRACVAEEGLNTIYAPGFPERPIPADKLPLDETVEHVAAWVRNAIEWIVAYQQLDQSFTRVVSLRAAVGEPQWTKVGAEDERVTLSVRLSDELFGAHDNVRLRAIGASLVGDVGVVPWTCVVSAPAEAAYLRAGVRFPVGQTDIPSCLLGRVENRDSRRPVEMCGAISLMNASPLGQATSGGAWTVDIIRPAGTRESFQKLEDVLLEISVVGRPRGAK